MTIIGLSFDFTTR